MSEHRKPAVNTAGSAAERTMSDRVSLTEIAALAEVSEATVSRVMNRRPGVAPATRAAVERALQRLGYVRSLEGQFVAVLAPTLVNPFFARLGEHIADELTPYGIRTIACAIGPGPVQERDFVAMLVEIGIAGAIFMSSSNTIRHADRTPAEVLTTRRVPFVTVNGSFDDYESPTFSTDETIAAKLAVDHLHSLGHTRIGLAVGPAGNIPSDRRVEGFVRAMAEAGLADVEELIARQFYTTDGGRHAADDLLARGATGIIAGSDAMALGAIQAARRSGLRVPEDVSVIGYDDDTVLEFTDPPLTTIRTPVEKLAEESARAVVAMVSGRSVESRELFFDPELHLRRSTGPVR